MAKKKTAETANIKAAPVLRAQSGGEQPTPTPEQTGTRTYQIMDPWKDRGAVNLVDVKAVDGEITEVKVNGQPAGGGGNTTAQVTILNNSENEIELSLVTLATDPLGPYYNGPTYVSAGSETYTVPLYEGENHMFIIGYTISSVTGSATIIGNNIKITGDCSFTIA